MKKIKFLLIFSLAVVVMAVFGYTQINKNSSSTDTRKYDCDTNKQYSSYGLGGNITSVAVNSFVMSGTIIQKTTDGICKPSTVSRTVSITSDTKLVKTTTITFRQPIKFSDIVVGARVDVDTKQNIITQTNLTADQVEILAN